MIKKIRQIRPCGDMVLIKHDEDRQKTTGGILLPDASKVRSLTGVIVEKSENISADFSHFDKLDRVLYDPRDAIPIDFDSQFKMYFLVPVQAIYAIIEYEDIS